MASPIMKVKVSVDESALVQMLWRHIFAFNELYMCCLSVGWKC